MRIATLLLLLFGCNNDSLDSGAADLSVADLFVAPDANVCAPSPESCEMALTCPAGEYCYVPWNEISFCGAAPTDGGHNTPSCLAPKCSPTIPGGCMLMSGHVECSCL